MRPLLLALIIPLLVGPAQAQEAFVDVGVEIQPVTTPIHQVIVTVANHGTLPAYDIDVTVVVDPFGKDGDSSGRNSPGPPYLSATLDLFRTWRIHRLDPKEEATDKFQPFLSNPPNPPSAGIYEWTAEVSTASREDPQRKHNNQVKAWQYIVTNPTEYGEARPDYSLTVSVDNYFPATDGSGMVNFTLTARDNREARASGIFTDGAVSIALTPDLTAGTPMFAIGGTSDTTHQSYSNGMWHIGEVGNFRGQPFTMTLPVTVDSGAVLEEQCLTAELSARPPAGIGERYDDGSDNRARICLGASEPNLFSSGRVDTFTTYPCVGTTDPPCDTTEDVRVRAIDQTGNILRSTLNSPKPSLILPPGTTVIKVQEKPARTYDGFTHNGSLQSVNDGTTVSWQTIIARIHHTTSIEYNRSPEHGVWISWSRVPFNDHLTSWQNLRLTFTASDGDGGDPPGKMHLRSSANNRALFRLNSGNLYTFSVGPLSLSTSATRARWYAEFEKLGTYIVEYAVEAKHTSLSGDCDTNNDDTNDAFCATETYTFHVGPLADLEVRSGPPSPDVTGQHLVIEALNHGPDTVKGARIPLDFLDPANIREVIPSEGYYNEVERAWYLPQHQNVGVFRTTGYRRSASQPSAATLTIRTRGLTDNPAPPVSIASYQDYQVCIASDGTDLAHTDQTTCEADTTNGGSWHTTPYYDYKPANNTAPLTLHTAPRSSTELTATETSGQVRFRWSSQPDAETYGIEVSTDGEDWTHLASGLTDTTYTYEGLLPAGTTLHYRVHSINEAGERSLPFAQHTATAGSVRVVVGGGGGSGSSRASTRPSGPTRLRAAAAGPTRINLYWSGPRTLYNGNVTSYELEVSPDRDHWTTVEPYLAPPLARPDRRGTTTTRRDATRTTHYTHTGLTPNTTYYYRVYAHNSRGRSLASPVVAGTTAAARRLTGFLDSPPPLRSHTAQSGIGAVFGWECDAEDVIVQIDGTPHPAVYGLARADTRTVCGDTDNGFEFMLNWNELGDGLHDIVVLVDGVELGRARVDVTTFGTAFLRGAHGSCTVPDFPTPGDSVTLVWQEARQHFVLTDGRPPPRFPSTGPSALAGALENPAPNTFQSGLGLLSGWVCDADEVTVEIDGQPYPVPSGLTRPDTRAVCGDADNGFAKVFNWNALENREYAVAAAADGAVFDRATVQVLAPDIPPEAEGQCTVPDFPAPGDSVTLTWQPDQQQFVITDTP